MTRGNNLLNDLKLLINNPQYSDLEIKCKDGTILYGNRAILAARSEVFDRMLFTRTNEISNKQISFLKIEASVMNIILEYLYTGSISDENLSADNAFETSNAADFFQLKNLQDLISDFYVKSCNEKGENNKSPELLSKAVQILSSSTENGIIDFLVDSVAKIQLDTIGFDRLSFQAFKCLLSKSNDKNKTFVTSEYSVLRFAILLAAKRVSQEAFSTLEKRLPVWDIIKDDFHLSNNDVQDIADICASTANNMASLVDSIDLKCIDTKILADIIESLNIIPIKNLLDVYRFYCYGKKPYSPFRSVQYLSEDIRWDENGCHSDLVISSDGYTVSLLNNKTHHVLVRTNLLMRSGLHRLRIKIEELVSHYVRPSVIIGVCDKNINYSSNVGTKGNGWGVSGDGNQYIDGVLKRKDMQPYEFNGSEIIVSLDMDNKEFLFSANGNNVTISEKLPSELYFAASLSCVGKIRIIH